MRRPQLVPLVLAAAVAATAAGCSLVGDPGPPTTQSRTIEDTVTGVELHTSGDVVITTGREAALSITAGSNVIDSLTSGVQGDVLVLGTRGVVGNLGQVDYELALPSVEELTVSGSGTITVKEIDGARLEVTVSGSGAVRADGVNVTDVGATVSGSGSVEIAGKAETLRAVVSGSGRIAGYGLAALDAEVEVSGSGRAEVDAEQSLDARVSGSGEIRYTGSAAVKSQVSGSGSVSPR